MKFNITIVVVNNEELSSQEEVKKQLIWEQRCFSRKYEN